MPFGRFPGWVERYGAAHPGTTWLAEPGVARAESPDGTRVQVDVPGGPLAEPSLAGLLDRLGTLRSLGVLLVRKGGFAVALLDGGSVVELKVGRRHVQGRSKAGGWSQHRFARRRDNQARAAFDAAAAHAHRILVASSATLAGLGTGGDRRAVANVLAHPELGPLADVPTTWLGSVPDPTRAVLDRAIADLRSVQVTITDP